MSENMKKLHAKRKKADDSQQSTGGGVRVSPTPGTSGISDGVSVSSTPGTSGDIGDGVSVSPTPGTSGERPLNIPNNHAELRLDLIKDKLSDPARVEHSNFLLSGENLMNIAKHMTCDFCGGHCVHSFKKLVLDTQSVFSCVNCENVVYKTTIERTPIPEHRQKISSNTLALVHHCMQHDLGDIGCHSLCVSLGLPALNFNIFT